MPCHPMATVKDRVAEVAEKEHSDLEVVFQPPFYEGQRLHQSTRQLHQRKTTRRPSSLFSYHGIPVRHLKKTDPSKVHCARVKDCRNIEIKKYMLCATNTKPR